MLEASDLKRIRGKRMNSKAKGARGEREFSKFCRDYGYETRRGQQYSGANGDADVIGLPGIHVEVKRTERLSIYDAMTQAIRDKKPGLIPVVFHRKNNCGWLAVMRAEDWMEIYKEHMNDSMQNL
jgi:hypothetical protein